MKTAGFLLFVFVGFFGSLIFIYYIWSPFLIPTGPHKEIIAGDETHATASPPTLPGLTPSPTPFLGPDGIVYHYY